MNEERDYDCLSAAGNAERLNERVERIMEFAPITTAEGCTGLEVYSYLSGLDTELSKVKKELEVFKEGGARASGEDALACLSSHKTGVNRVFYTVLASRTSIPRSWTIRRIAKLR